MSAFFLICMGGLFAGALHVLSGPDHLAAVSTVLADRPKRAISLGVVWGLGHGLGVFCLGALGQLAKDVIDIHVLSGWSELIVGFLLVALGLWNLRLKDRYKHAVQATAHEASEHHHSRGAAGLKSTSGEDVEQEDGAAGASREADGGQALGSSFGIGLFHGMAGASHLFGVLPSVAMEPTAAATYLISYVVGSLVVMGIFAFGASLLMRDPSRRPLALQVTGWAAVLVGLIWIGKTLPI